MFHYYSNYLTGIVTVLSIWYLIVLSACKRLQTDSTIKSAMTLLSIWFDSAIYLYCTIAWAWAGWHKCGWAQMWDWNIWINILKYLDQYFEIFGWIFWNIWMNILKYLDENFEIFGEYVFQNTKTQYVQICRCFWTQEWVYLFEWGQQK